MRSAATLFRNWIHSGALCLDDTPSVYLLRSSPTDGIFFERKAFFALIKLPEPGNIILLPSAFDKPVGSTLVGGGAGILAHIRDVF